MFNGSPLIVCHYFSLTLTERFPKQPIAKASKMVPFLLSENQIANMVNTSKLVACQGKPVWNFHKQDIPRVTRLLLLNCF